MLDNMTDDDGVIADELDWLAQSLAVVSARKSPITVWSSARLEAI
jgi:hypothetical protein